MLSDTQLDQWSNELRSGHFRRFNTSVGHIADAVIGDSHFNKTEELHHFLVATALPLTARRAAAIEPTIQEPISKVRTLKTKSPSNSTVLSSIRASSLDPMQRVSA
jgi:hypothetical protein